MNDLRRRIEELARSPVLLVASDYDGTVAPIVSEPSQAVPHREALVALRSLAAMPSTHVAVISGRALRNLSASMGTCDGFHLVGSHGGEFDLDFSRAIAPELSELRSRISRDLAAIAQSGDGFQVEDKPASVAFHYRNADDERARVALEKIFDGPAAAEGIHTRHGKKVVELSVVPTDKGHALQKLRQRVGASAVVFFGDDVTDEDAFASLSGPDVGVKVGAEATVASYRVADTGEVARVLVELCQLRGEWLEGPGAVPIEAHSFLSDQRTVALVTPDARVSWLCLPRLDSPALFAELLGGPAAGRFAVRAGDGSAPLGQAYEERSMVLRTRWPEFVVTDFLDCSHGRPRQRAGRSELVRILSGRGRVQVEFAPRLDFGRMPTRISRHANGLQVLDTHDPIVLRAPGIQWEIVDEGPHQTARAELELGERPQVLDLRYGTGNLDDTTLSGDERREVTTRHWADWAAALDLPAVEPDLVLRSALALKALCYGPTGAIAAAGTTSLPETAGGVRNWDYRYCWLRDGALSAAALLSLGSQEESMRFLDWVLAVLDTVQSPVALQPLYTVVGGHVHADAEIGELCGYLGSRPVRVGNSAAQQVQLDVFGPIVQLIHELLVHEAPISPEHWRLVEALAFAVEERWQEPDHGIWEVRLQQRHHVHSKVMCWLTIDRAIAIARQYLEREPAQWIGLRDRIADDVLRKGWNPDVGAHTAAYGSADLDAAVLHLGISGLLAPGDPRFHATVDAVERVLRKGPTVYRYLYDDGLPGVEGGFHICASWLVDAYHLIGKERDAAQLFQRIVALAGPTGLLSEEYSAESQRALGNFPQAYSHVGLIGNAVRLAAGRPRGG